MHTWYYRLNALFTVATTVLAVLCALASITEILHTGSPVVRANVLRVDNFAADRGNDRAWLILDLSADLRSIFNWNTKQAYVYVTVDYSTKRNHLSRITIFDRIVQEGSSAFIKEPNLQIKWPFALNDQGRGLRGTAYNVTVAWQKVPISGLLLSGQRSFPGFQMPSDYMGSTKPGSPHNHP